ncbi:MAG: NfeD family protein [Candidatus Thioglobus sp.]|jgi:membrane protein implicated in regulation of membrane protease activity|nr:NfeD family protein [Candidatus Pseudothioglobus aerophilus]MBT3439418.1 NfeD family protein [Gammaproteobacteria bacterium]MDP0595521.1 NfeD family protein [Candidatus Thioglobus sp.]MBT4245313.1 NfeD family protein [Gammaproteobacteria bacterium]MBT4974050.1 NfeD family protein [Gammaproteobacteria bacterium]
MEFLFENLNFIHWLVLGIALIILELFVWTVFLLWIGSSAVTVGIIFFLFPNVSGLLQLLIFIVLAVAATLLSKKYYPVKTVDEQLHDKAKSHIGKECTIESVENGVTKVKIGESLWFAKGSDLSTGQSVKIIDVESSTFIVEPSK